MAILIFRRIFFFDNFHNLSRILGMYCIIVYNVYNVTTKMEDSCDYKVIDI